MCSFGSCQTRFEFLSQFRKVRNAFAKNQMRLAYEDKRDLYCSTPYSSLSILLFVDKYLLISNIDCVTKSTDI